MVHLNHNRKSWRRVWRRKSVGIHQILITKVAWISMYLRCVRYRLRYGSLRAIRLLWWWIVLVEMSRKMKFLITWLMGLHLLDRNRLLPMRSHYMNLCLNLLFYLIQYCSIDDFFAVRTLDLLGFNIQWAWYHCSHPLCDSSDHMWRFRSGCSDRRLSFDHLSESHPQHPSSQPCMQGINPTWC